MNLKHGGGLDQAPFYKEKFPRKITSHLFGELWLAIQYFSAKQSAPNRCSITLRGKFSS